MAHCAIISSRQRRKVRKSNRNERHSACLYWKNRERTAKGDSRPDESFLPNRGYSGNSGARDEPATECSGGQVRANTALEVDARLFHVRCTVRSETPRIAAISANEKPI